MTVYQTIEERSVVAPQMPCSTVQLFSAAGDATQGTASNEEIPSTPAAYDSFRIISKKALADYKRAERLFLDFLANANVWSQDEVSETIIDFHLVEKCRTKFRAFVKGFGAKVRFDPVTSTPRKQEYHGTVTVTRACKQQFLTNYLQVIKPGAGVESPGKCEDVPDHEKTTLQCSAPTPITTGQHFIAYEGEEAQGTPKKDGSVPVATEGTVEGEDVAEGGLCPGTPSASHTAGIPAMPHAHAPAPHDLPLPGDGDLAPAVACSGQLHTRSVHMEAPPTGNAQQHNYGGEYSMPQQDMQVVPDIFGPVPDFDDFFSYPNTGTACNTPDGMPPPFEPQGPYSTHSEALIHPSETHEPSFAPGKGAFSCSDGFCPPFTNPNQLHGSNTCAAGPDRRASCGPEIFANHMHSSCFSETLPDCAWAPSNRRTSEPPGMLCLSPSLGQKRLSDGLAISGHLSCDVSHQSGVYMPPDGLSRDLDPCAPSPTKSPRISYDAGEAFARHMQGYMHAESGAEAFERSPAAACGSPRVLAADDIPGPFEPAGEPEASGKLGVSEPSMDCLWQMLAAEPPLGAVAEDPAVVIEPCSFAAMEGDSMQYAAAPAELNAANADETLSDAACQGPHSSRPRRAVLEVGAVLPSDRSLAGIPSMCGASLNNEMTLTDLPQALTKGLSISNLPSLPTLGANDRGMSCYVDACLGSQPSARDWSFKMIPMHEGSIQLPRATSSNVAGLGVPDIDLSFNFDCDRNAEDAAVPAVIPEEASGDTSEMGEDENRRGNAQVHEESQSQAMSKEHVADGDKSGEGCQQQGINSGKIVSYSPADCAATGFTGKRLPVDPLAETDRAAAEDPDPLPGADSAHGDPSQLLPGGDLFNLFPKCGQ